MGPVRLRLLLVTLAFIAVALGVGTRLNDAGASGASQALSLDSSLLSQLNAVRLQAGLDPLVVSAGLTESATDHTREMLTNGYFGHSSPNGSPFWRRIERYYPLGDYHYWSVGENILWTSENVTASTAVSAWMHSPPHRANILSTKFRQIGIAALSSSSPPGVFKRSPTTVITTDFGVRSRG